MTRWGWQSTGDDGGDGHVFPALSPVTRSRAKHAICTTHPTPRDPTTGEVGTHPYSAGEETGGLTCDATLLPQFPSHGSANRGHVPQSRTVDSGNPHPQRPGLADGVSNRRGKDTRSFVPSRPCHGALPGTEWPTCLSFPFQPAPSPGAAEAEQGSPCQGPNRQEGPGTHSPSPHTALPRGRDLPAGCQAPREGTTKESKSVPTPPSVPARPQLHWAWAQTRRLREPLTFPCLSFHISERKENPKDPPRRPGR